MKLCVARSGYDVDCLIFSDNVVSLPLESDLNYVIVDLLSIKSDSSNA